MSVVAPLAIGFVFAWLLQRAGLSRYDRIVNIFRLRDLAVLKFLMSALVTAAVGVRILASLGFAEDLPIPSTYVAGNLLGGAVFGVGMALSGFCPGTVAAGAGWDASTTWSLGCWGCWSGRWCTGWRTTR